MLCVSGHITENFRPDLNIYGLEETSNNESKSKSKETGCLKAKKQQN